MEAKALDTGTQSTPLRSPIAAMIAYRRDPLAFLVEVGRHGPLVSFKLGPRRIHLVNAPELVRRVVAADQKAFAKGRPMQAAELIFGNGLLRSEGELHARQRRLIQPLFHRGRIEEYASAMVEVADARQRRWRPGDRLDMEAEMRALTMTVIGRTMFSTDIERDAEELSHAIGSATEYTKLLALPGKSVLKRLPLPSVRRAKAGIEAFDRLFARVVEQHGGSASGSGDLLSTLLDPAACGRSDAGLRQVRDEALTMLLAGHATTATTLALAWALLDTHPAVADRFHDELDSALQGGPPTVEHLPQLSFTDAVFKETLRLYPPSWLFSRVATDEFDLDGKRIMPGSVLLVCPWVIHRNHELYDDPVAFKPDRWLDGSTDGLPKYSLVPFGGGPRKCIGEGFAWTEATLVLATIGRRWAPHFTRKSFEVEPQLALVPKDGVPMILRLRERGQGSGDALTPAGETRPGGDGGGYWDQVAPIWEGGGGQRLWRRHSDAVNRRVVEEWLPDGAKAVMKTDLWDEAMGEGLYPAIARNGTQVTGIDVSEAILASALDRYPDLETHRADLRSLPFPDNRFDAVVSNSSLDHFASAEDILLSLRELRRVLRRGGTLLLTLDNPANPIVGLSKALPRGPLNRLWLRFGGASRRLGLLPYYVGATYGRHQLGQVLTREGFAVEQTTAIMHAPRPLAVIAGHLLERRGGAAAQERFLRWLLAWERLAGSPTRFVSGHFTAVRAKKL
jgi:cytochrome P450